VRRWGVPLGEVRRLSCPPRLRLRQEHSRFRDAPLSPAGRRQAEDLAAPIAAFAADLIAVSPMRRAMQVRARERLARGRTRAPVCHLRQDVLTGRGALTEPGPFHPLWLAQTALHALEGAAHAPPIIALPFLFEAAGQGARSQGALAALVPRRCQALP
jgi:hypothetical protein